MDKQIYFACNNIKDFEKVDNDFQNQILKINSYNKTLNNCCYHFCTNEIDEEFDYKLICTTFEIKFMKYAYCKRHSENFEKSYKYKVYCPI